MSSRAAESFNTPAPGAHRPLREVVAAVRGARCIHPVGPLTVTAVAEHTDEVTPGSLFVCVRGSRCDGHDMAPRAVQRGAVALLVERELDLPRGVPQVLVTEGRAAAADAAREFHRRPDARLLLCGVTGTNGKTTTAFLLASVLERAGLPCGLMGTVAYRVGSEERPAPLTTPGPAAFYGMLGEMVAAGQRAAVAEASSHALAQGRVRGEAFDTAIFTNLSRDHLDFHGSAAAYLDAKARLFEARRECLKRHPALAVVSVDGWAGRRLAERLAGGRRRLITCGLAADAVVRGQILAAGAGSSEVRLESPFGCGTVRVPLPGVHNVRNALAAAAAALGQGLPFAAVALGIASVPHVPGRMDRVDLGQPFDVWVDFAHNPGGLRAALQTVRRSCRGRVILVFGCKGEDGDDTKRLRMGQVAGRLADCIVVTTDDPHGEDPEPIAARVAAGVRAAGHAACLVVIDRAEAVRTAVAVAKPGDAVLVAGRGHETRQLIAGRAVPLCDRDLCREALLEALAERRALHGGSARRARNAEAVAVRQEPAEGAERGTEHGCERGAGHGAEQGAGQGVERGAGQGAGQGAGHGAERGAGHGAAGGPGQGAAGGPGQGAERGAGRGAEQGAGHGAEPMLAATRREDG